MTNVLILGACGKMGGNVLSLLQGDKEAKAVCGVDLFPKEIGIPVYENFSDVAEAVDVMIDFSSPQNLQERLESTSIPLPSRFLKPPIFPSASI